MHHIHAGRAEEGNRGVGWHNDYHCAANCHDREQLMVHCFFYFNGLDRTIGDLLALPRSHKKVLRGPWNILNSDGGPCDLPGIQVFGEGNPLPDGSVVIVHSGLMHARRAKPGFVRPRYFVDISYCQPGQHRWPAYENFGAGGHAKIFETALELGHDRDGEYRGLFDMGIFYDMDLPETMEPELQEAHADLRRWSVARGELSARHIAQ